jgi:hypothetical protein
VARGSGRRPRPLTGSRRCTRCEVERVDRMFAWRASGHLHSWCRYCKIEYDREKAREQRRENRAV